MKNPIVTLVIPTFNCEQSLSRTLNSLISQTSKRWECLLIDDGSTDATCNIIEQFCLQDDRFTYYQNLLGHSGANISRNLGVSFARCEFLIFIDADDYIASDCIEKRIEIIEDHNQYDLIIFKTAVVDLSDKVIGCFSAKDQNQEKLLTAFIRQEIPWQTMSPVWKKSFLDRIGGWNESYLRLQDVEISIRSIINNAKIYFCCNRVDSFYVQTPLTKQKINSALKSFNQLLKDYYYVVMNDSNWQCYHDEIHIAFAVLIEKIIKFYLVNSEAPILTWQEEFLEILNYINLDDNDIKMVSELFNDFDLGDDK